MINLSRPAFVGLTLIAIAGAIGTLGWNWSKRHHLATMLNIKEVPQSVREIDCASFGVTDVLERCSFELEPIDFPKLLSGYGFQMPKVCGTGKVDLCVDSSDEGMSHDYCCGPKTGKNFHIASTYIATPGDAQYGGRLTVVTDVSRQRAMVDLYIE